MVYPMPPKDNTQPTPDYFAEVDGEQSSVLLRLLMFYKLSAKVTMRTVEKGEWDVWHVWSDGRDLGGLEASQESGVLSEDPRGVGLGWRWLGMNGRLPSNVDVEEVAEESYRLRRYLHGVAEGQLEMPREQALPMEYNMDLMNGIDFQKGCYVGQELQARTKYLGVVQKRVLPCVIYPVGAPVPETLEYEADSTVADTIERGTAIQLSMTDSPAGGKRDKRPGKWVAGIGNIGLAVCKMAVMTDVVPPAPPRMALPQPTRHPDDEFQISLSEEKSVRIKAFVPRWLRRGLETYHD